MKKSIGVFLFIGILLLHSCVSENNFLMKRVRPAAYTFPDYSKNVLFVNDLSLTDVTLQAEQINIFETLVGEVLEQTFFDSIHSIDQKVTQSFSKIAETHYPQADAMISLSDLRLKSVRNTEENASYVALIGQVDLQIFVPDQKTESKKISIRDTVYSDLYDALLDQTDLYIMMINKVRAGLTSKAIAGVLPYQIEENRTVFSWSDVNTRDAQRYLMNGNIHYSEIIWTALLEEMRKPLYRAYLYSNLSFTAENDNRLDKAIEYLRLAQKEIASSSKKNTKELLRYLRSVERSIFEKQQDQILLKRQIRN